MAKSRVRINLGDRKPAAKNDQSTLTPAENPQSRVRINLTGKKK